ncbi:MAG TPA: imidazole glycerol phosphate synthase subunit HisH [Fibrobacteria bacterium]|jgi:glutamine amidotransferase|nr:imidazole glycerol phosphate synthase subunit HisH [Fibrobacteria bacterium]
MVTLADYGLGNIQAFAHIYDRLNIPVEVATTPGQIAKAERIILPGVGAFDWAMRRLNASGLREALDERVLKGGVPVLGVCVGMQMMARGSDEGALPGLGWIDAEVRKFDASVIGDSPLPHMGWNDVHPASSGTLFRGIEAPRYYFLHTYYFAPDSSADVLATANYGSDFAAAVARDNVFGTQFHPEKSHQWGIDLLRNFAEL